MTTENPQSLNVTGAVVAVLLVLLLGLAIGALLMRAVPDANMNVLLVLLGALATNVTNVVQFLFGSSAGTRQKDSTLATLANTAAAAQAALPSVNPSIPVAPGEKLVVEGSGDASVPDKPAKTKP